MCGTLLDSKWWMELQTVTEVADIFCIALRRIWKTGT
jgi:hypothetical protein